MVIKSEQKRRRIGVRHGYFVPGKTERGRERGREGRKVGHKN